MAEKKNRMVTSIKIDSDLWKKAKISAIKKDIELSLYVEEAIARQLDLDASKERKK